MQVDQHIDNIAGPHEAAHADHVGQRQGYRLESRRHQLGQLMVIAEQAGGDGRSGIDIDRRNMPHHVIDAGVVLFRHDFHAHHFQRATVDRLVGQQRLGRHHHLGLRRGRNLGQGLLRGLVGGVEYIVAHLVSHNCQEDCQQHEDGCYYFDQVAAHPLASPLDSLFISCNYSNLSTHLQVKATAQADNTAGNGGMVPSPIGRLTRLGNKVPPGPPIRVNWTM